MLQLHALSATAPRSKYTKIECPEAGRAVYSARRVARYHPSSRMMMRPFALRLPPIVAKEGQGGGPRAPQLLELLLVGVLRDLRGVVCACSNRRAYGLFFEWLYPAFTPLMLVPLIRSMLLQPPRGAPSPLTVALTMHARHSRQRTMYYYYDVPEV